MVVGVNAPFDARAMSRLTVAHLVRTSVVCNQGEVISRGLGDTELGEVVVDHRRAVGVEQLALERAESMVLVGEFHVATNTGHAAQVFGLHLHELALGAEGANALGRSNALTLRFLADAK